LSIVNYQLSILPENQEFTGHIVEDDHQDADQELPEIAVPVQQVYGDKKDQQDGPYGKEDPPYPAGLPLLIVSAHSRFGSFCRVLLTYSTMRRKENSKKQHMVTKVWNFLQKMSCRFRGSSGYF
jgi:hypothetical protein